MKSCYYRKKSNPPISLSQYLSIPHFPPPNLAKSFSPCPHLTLSERCSIIFRMGKKYMTIKSLMPGESEGWPKGDPTILIRLCPTFHPPPLIALTHGGCHSPLTFPSHTRYCLNHCCHHRPNSSLSEHLLCTHTHIHTYTHTHTHTQAKEILIIISEWYDWIRSRREMKEKQKLQRWEIEKRERERLCVDEGI